MRITGCHIKAFGSFRDERFEGLDHPVIVVLGDNETGKSTLRHFMTTMLYGIVPDEAAVHPYAPRNGRTMEGQLSFRRADGTKLSVSRSLGAQPQARLINDTEEALYNRSIPSVQQVPEAVFKSVYSLEVADLAAELSDDTLSSLRSSLFRAFDAASMRSVRQVTAELEREAEALWQPDAPAASEVGNLERRLDELAEEITAAQAAEQRARQCYREIRDLQRKIEEGWMQQEDLRVRLRRVERLVPVYGLLQQIDKLREQGGQPEQYSMLPENPQVSLRDQEKQLADLESALRERRRRIRELEQGAEPLTETERRLLKRKSDIEAWTTKVDAHERRGARLEAARQEKREARHKLEDVAERLLAEPWHSELAPAVRQLSLGELRQRMRDHEEAVRELESAKARAEAMSGQAKVRRALWPWLLMAALGVAGGLIHSAAVVTIPYWDALAIGLMLAGLIQAVANELFNRQLEQPPGSLDLEEYKTEVEEKAALVIERLSSLPISQERIQQLDRDLIGDVQELFETLRAYDERAERVEEEAGAMLEENEEVEALAAACNVEADSHELVYTVARLAEDLEAAQTHRRATQEAESELPVLREEVRKYKQRLVAMRQTRTKWVRALKELGDGDVEAGCQVLRERREAERRRRRAEDRLHEEFPDWEERRSELRKLNADESWSADEKARLQTRIQALSDRINQLRRQRDEKRDQLADMNLERSSADLASERADVQERLSDRQRRRDQLLLLRNLLLEGHRRFREHNQPEALQRASDFLRRITGGHYERIMMDDEDWKLRVSTDKGHQAVSTPPLSQGTFDQIHFAFRVALMRDLDEKGERLPLFLDEVFVNWDTERRRGAFDVLGEIAGERQIFVFTCHPYFARETTDFLDGTLIRLSAL